jgi:phage gp46-like protein
MQDIKLVPDTNGLYDISIENGNIGTVDGFQTTLVVSLFTDARAPSSIVPNAYLRRGWVGDILKASQDKKTGSYLWTIDQARMIKSTFQQADLHTIDALQHLIDNNNAKNVNVEVIPGQKTIEIQTDIKIDENNTERYNTLWRSTNASGLSNV